MHELADEVEQQLERLAVRWLDDLPGAAEAARNLNTPAELEQARQESRAKCTIQPAPVPVTVLIISLHQVCAISLPLGFTPSPKVCRQED